MRMLVGVGVSDGDSGLLQSPDLRLGLAFDIALANLTSQQSLNERQQRRTKAAAVRPYQRRNPCRIRYRYTIGKDDVAAHT